MLPIIAAVLGFVIIASLGWVFVGGDDSSTQALKRAQGLGVNRTSNATSRKAAAAANTPEARRKQIMLQLKEAERKDRKARMTMEAKLRHAGLKLKIRTFWIISAVMAVLGFLIPLVIGWNVFLAIGVAVILGAGAPRWAVGFMGARRMKKFSAEFANSVDVIVRGIKSGLPVHECFKIIAKEAPAPLGPEFQRLVEELAVGLTLGQALEKMFERMPTPELRFFAVVIAIQQKTGGNLAEALSNLTSVLRARRMMVEKIKALSSEALASAGIIAALPPVVMGLVYITTPAYMGLLFTDPRGQLMLLAAGFWMSCGVFVMKRMISFKF